MQTETQIEATERAMSALSDMVMERTPEEAQLNKFRVLLTQYKERTNLEVHNHISNETRIYLQKKYHIGA